MFKRLKKENTTVNGQFYVMEEVTSRDSQWSAGDMFFSISINYSEMGVNNEMTVCAAASIKINGQRDKGLLGRTGKSQTLVKSMNIEYKLCLIFEGSKREQARKDTC